MTYDGIQFAQVAGNVDTDGADGAKQPRSTAPTDRYRLETLCAGKCGKSHVAISSSQGRYLRCHQRRLLIVGEVHGNNEAPDLVASLVRDALPTRTVRLGLEMQRSEQAPLDAYLQSAGSAADQAMFLKSPFWSMQDGRSSTAMLRLIDTARALRAEGAKLEVFAMEPDYGDQAAIASAGGPQKFKESSMAQAIQRAVDKSDSRQLVIALMGNFHARYGSDNPPSLKLGPSVADRLASERPYIVLPFARTNTTWNCQQDGCAVHTYTSTNAPKGDLPQFISDSAESKGPVVMRLWLPKMTAALPARKATP